MHHVTKSTAGTELIFDISNMYCITCITLGLLGSGHRVCSPEFVPPPPTVPEFSICPSSCVCMSLPVFRTDCTQKSLNAAPLIIFDTCSYPDNLSSTSHFQFYSHSKVHEITVISKEYCCVEKYDEFSYMKGNCKGKHLHVYHFLFISVDEHLIVSHLSTDP